MRREHFEKIGPASHAAMFAAEAEGVAALAATHTVRVPACLGHGVENGRAWIRFERLDLRRPSAMADAELGRRLAALHRHTGPAYGWDADNFIGATPQPNARDGDWVRFFAERRLGFQLRLAARNGWGGDLQVRGTRLLERLPGSLGHDPAPSLLHGDLWTGNRAMLADGTPVVYDPAVHHGDRECDLAMADLFGGFHPGFFAAYMDAWPLPDGWQRRRRIYQLYHVLNHLNLFGGGYLDQALSLIE